MLCQKHWLCLRGFMKLKKAQTDPIKVLVTMLVVLAVATAVLFRSWDKGIGALKTLSPAEVNAKNKVCEIAGKQLAEKGTLKEPIELSKGDGFPDDCDICLGGDNRIVSTSSGIPDACYAQTTSEFKIQTYKDMCKARGGCYISDTDQCCLGNVACGPKCKK